MPELPDVTLYVERLAPLVTGQVLERVRLASPFLLRSVEPPLASAPGRRVTGVRRLGKRIVLALDGGAGGVGEPSAHGELDPPAGAGAPGDAGAFGDAAAPGRAAAPGDAATCGRAAAAGQPEALFLVLHLMVAGRLRWRPAGAAIPGRNGLAAFDFAPGTLLLTEASPKKRASLTLVRGEAALAALDPGGIEVLDADLASFRAALGRESHTLKRALTDPSIFSGIGNAYSDEILHRARLSPFKRSTELDDEESERLFQATRVTLAEWTERLRRDTPGFPEKVTAFRPEMAVHGRFGLPCPRCGAPVQRIVYAENEANYCAACQTGGRLLADRALSRLLKADWPRTVAELEERKRSQRAAAAPGETANSPVVPARGAANLKNGPVARRQRRASLTTGAGARRRRTE
jgi:formamidopyrimidine-DNA glycosylase